MNDENNAPNNVMPELVFGESVPKAPDMPNIDGISESAPAAVAEIAQPEKQVLTPEEQQRVDAFVKTIDLTNSQAVMSYGISTQKEIASFSQKTIDNIKTKDFGTIGETLTGLVNELKDFDAESEDKGGFLGLFKAKSNNLDKMRTKYQTVEKNINFVTDKLEQHQVTLLKDIKVLDQMYQLNLNYFRELTMYIAAGRQKLEQVRSTELAELRNKAAQTGLAEDAQAANDLAALCDRFEKKVYDLEVTRTIALQTAPQIRMVQSSDTVMAEKIQSTILNTIPLWKSQMVIAIGIEHSEQAAKAEAAVNDMTNELLKSNADRLHSAAVNTAKEAEKSIVSMETLRHTNEQLIATIDEVIAIQKDGKEQRKQAEAELGQIEEQLKQKLLEASGR